MFGETREGTWKDVEWKAKEGLNCEELWEVVKWKSRETLERERLIEGGELIICQDIMRRMEKE